MFLEKPNYDIKVENSQIDINLFSTIGMREEQQDSAGYELYDERALVVICDGMGGHQGGRIASSLAVNKLLENYSAGKMDNDIHQGFVDSVTEIDSRIAQIKSEDGSPMNCGTTMVAVDIRNNLLNWVSVGDSRIYIHREEEFIQITQDHTYDLALKENVESGMINNTFFEEETKYGEALISFLGINGLPLIDCSVQPLQLISGDRIILMSDGLYKMVEDNSIGGILSNFKNVSDAIQALESKAQSFALKNEISRDNMTVAVITIK